MPRGNSKQSTDTQPSTASNAGTPTNSQQKAGRRGLIPASLLIAALLMLQGCAPDRDDSDALAHGRNSEPTLGGCLGDRSEAGVRHEGQPCDAALHEHSGVANGAVYSVEGEYRWLKYYVDGVQEGLAVAWTADRLIATTQSWSHGRPEGPWLVYYPSGMPESLTEYRRGTREGNYTMWHGNGLVAVKGEYKNGMVAGVWKAYSMKGEIILEHEVALEVTSVWDALKGVGILDPDE